jgi:3-deoxy-D-arabino-heptulosonate 7-phosphate (DAHP) synthase
MKYLQITGPCAAESKEQIHASIKLAKKRNVDFMRISLWKPRTKPGFDGLKEDGIQLLVDAAKAGVNPSTEVLLPENAQKILDQVLPHLGKGKLLLWIGARNQNHYIQQEIARVCAQDSRVYLMMKNQPWVSEDHWMGIIEHGLTGGIKPDHLIICHRGFAPMGENPLNLRNMPDYEMAMRVKDKMKLKMVFDPSHIGGTVENVVKIANEAKKYDFDGFIIEVHPNPKVALTDAKQQLTWEQFDALFA